VKTIAIIAQKGGVGKTAIAVNLAVAASKRLNVALFDLDSQESASFGVTTASSIAACGIS